MERVNSLEKQKKSEKRGRRRTSCVFMEEMNVNSSEIIWSHLLNPLLLCFLSLFPLVCFMLIKPRKSSASPNLPPSPAKLPIIGNLHQLGRLPHKSLRDLSLKHGPLMFVHLGTTRVLVISSSDVVEEITKNHDIAFSDRYTTTALRPFTESGQDLVFSRYGDHWRQVKKISVLHLLSQRIVNKFQTLREEEISAMAETIRVLSLKGSEINLRDLFASMVSSVVYRSFTGRRKCDQVFKGMNFGDWSAKFKKLAEAFCFADLFPSLGWMDKLTGFADHLKSTFKDLDGFMDCLINECNNGSRDEKSFVDILLRLQEDGDLNYELTLTDVKAIMQGLFAAATDTVTMLMEWVMAELVRHPKIMEKAQDEIQRVVGTKTNISSNDINQMHYLKCIIRETTRLHPFGLIPRETTKSVKIYGYEIPSKTKVMVNTWAIHRDPKVWENPDEFIPERFMNMKIDFKGQQKGFFPFGFGRRYCPGVYFALTLLENVIANLLFRFNWELPGGSKPEELNMSEKFQLAAVREHPLRLVAIPRALNNAKV